MQSAVEELHRFNDTHIGDDFAQPAYELKLLGIQQQLFATCTRSGDIDGGPDALFNELACEV